MSKEQKTQHGEIAFNETYTGIYGARWESLKEAMLSKKDMRAWNSNARRVHGADDTDDAPTPYLLDSASILAALSLPLLGAQRILDCCAAPGGKTIILASLMDTDAVLTANDRSRERAARLRTTVRDCLPREIQSRVTITTGDAALLAKKNAAPVQPFDAIFLDAPCSSERHVLESPYHLALWSPARIKNLVHAQWALLSAAFRLLKNGGIVTYATCALHPQENDFVVNRLLRKFPQAKIIPRQLTDERSLVSQPLCASAFFKGDLPVPEKTETGYRVLPDFANGAGPMFFSCIQKDESDDCE